MLLEKLVEYAEREGVPPKMYQETTIRWLLDLYPDGTLRGWVSLDDLQTNKTPGRRMLAPHIQVTSGVKPKLLADKGEYVLGIPRASDPNREARVADQHRQFVALVKSCFEATQSDEVAAVAAFLRNKDPGKLGVLPVGFDPLQVITFRVGDRLPIDLPSVRAFWAEHTAQGDDNAVLPCLVCGQVAPAVDRLPVKIKGIPEGQTAGVAMVSANENAYDSYGHEASLNSPICTTCAEGAANALNGLLRESHAHLRVGRLVYVFWTRAAAPPFNPSSLLGNPDPDEVREFIASTFTGGSEYAHMKSDRFYATALSASGGRLVVRSWLNATVGDVQHNLARWFTKQQIVSPNGGDPVHFGARDLAECMYRKRPDVPPNVYEALVRSALEGSRVDVTLLSRVLQRIRAASDHVSHTRAAAVKLILESNQKGGSLTMEALQPDFPVAAYQWGRLLAELESIQRQAVPHANSTLIDKYFGAASSSPARMHSVLIRNAQAHLSKLHRDMPGAYVAHQQRLEEIHSRISPHALDHPLDVIEQGLFALGYYHERAEAHKQAALAKARRTEDKGDMMA